MATRAHFVKKARKDNINAGVKKGESYWWWQFAFSSKSYSKTQPTRQQLTRSAFWQSMYAIEDMIGNVSIEDDFQGVIDDIKAEIEVLSDECQNSLDNMPEQLQQAPSGEMLQNRIDELSSMVSDLENIDVEVDDDLKGDELENRKEEVTEEIKNVCYNGE